MPEWHIITGEYPPQPGGVSDYTRLLAHGLAGSGDEVHVWAPAPAAATPTAAGVRVHDLPGRFGRRALADLDAGLARARPGFRLLVQYVPHMYGMKAMNLPFCWWLWRRRHLRPWVMFHEVAYPCAWGQPLRHNVLGAMHLLMAGLVARAAERIFVSTPSWESRLRRVAPLARPAVWLPVPCTVAASADAASAEAIRDKALRPAGSLLIGHFGSFGAGLVPQLLGAVFPRVLKGGAGRVGLLIGRGSKAFAEKMLLEHPALAGRLLAAGELPDEGVAAHLRACDLLLQPYPDGVSGRRTSLMAGLALGLPVVSTRGPATESVWDEGLVALAPAGDTDALIAVTEGLLADRSARLRLGEEGRAGYGRHFSLDHTIRILRESEPEASPAPSELFLAD